MVISLPFRIYVEDPMWLRRARNDTAPLVFPSASVVSCPQPYDSLLTILPKQQTSLFPAYKPLDFPNTRSDDRLVLLSPSLALLTDLLLADFLCHHTQPSYRPADPSRTSPDYSMSAVLTLVQLNISLCNRHHHLSRVAESQCLADPRQPGQAYPLLMGQIRIINLRIGRVK